MAGRKNHAWEAPSSGAGPPDPADESPAALRRSLIALQARLHEVERQNEALLQVQAVLQASRDHYFELYDRAPMGYFTFDAPGTIQQANLTAASLLGVEHAALLGQPVTRFVCTEDGEIFRAHSAQLFATGEPQSCDLRLLKPDGTSFWGRLRSVGARGADGEVLGRMAFSDISDSKRTEEALREQEAFFHLIAENLCDFIAVLDLDGRRIYNSPSYQQFFGPVRNLRSTNSFAEIHPDDQERVKQAFRETVQSGIGRQLEFRFLTADGSVRHMESRGSVIRDGAGKVARVVVVSHDITERRQLQDEVRQLAFHDSLTRLPNRRLLCDRLNQALAASARGGTYGALMFLDLDNFKTLNDTQGHEVGDRLLVEAADRLKSCVREVDTVARFGGDEFVVVLGELATDRAESLAQAAAIAEKLRLALAQPYRLAVGSAGTAGHLVEHVCTACIGVALFNNQSTSQEAVFRCADAAMYQAKEAGSNLVRFCGEVA
ncbi:MAG TPA: diguanylate cyclase [Rhodocyclaceae bacterium]|nr:diguanylate cyclase [Rhodocyclaceae bacterium]